LINVESFVYKRIKLKEKKVYFLRNHKIIKLIDILGWLMMTMGNLILNKVDSLDYKFYKISLWGEIECN
jgi:hypothetical protein